MNIVTMGFGTENQFNIKKFKLSKSKMSFNSSHKKQAFNKTIFIPSKKVVK